MPIAKQYEAEREEVLRRINYGYLLNRQLPAGIPPVRPPTGSRQSDAVPAAQATVKGADVHDISAAKFVDLSIGMGPDDDVDEYLMGRLHEGSYLALVLRRVPERERYPFVVRMAGTRGALCGVGLTDPEVVAEALRQLKECGADLVAAANRQVCVVLSFTRNADLVRCFGRDALDGEHARVVAMRDRLLRRLGACTGVRS